MSAGIAKAIHARLPEAYEADLTTAKGDLGKLGTVSTAEIMRGMRAFVIANAYTQAHWRGEGQRVDYDALRNAMRAVRAAFGGRRIGYPKIGAGLGRGEWRIIEAIIAEELAGEDHTLVEFG